MQRFLLEQRSEEITRHVGFLQPVQTGVRGGLIRRDEAELYKRLATLRADVPLAESLADLAWRGADRGELEAVCATVGEDDLVALSEGLAVVLESLREEERGEARARRKNGK